MKKVIFILLFFPFVSFGNQDSLLVVYNIGFDSIINQIEQNEKVEIEIQKAVPLKSKNIVARRLQQLDNNSPMDLIYNDKVQIFIDSYLGRNKALVSRMKGLSPYYFPMFERELDKYNLPLEFKYLAIVESALNPKARSSSGASGLWQFMYLTGKQYGLDVTSYVDERQDPLKATKSACEYFVNLYDTFGDWNLVLAAYNGGPGYLQKKINSVGSSDFWKLYPYLRKETRNYIPTFIAINYVMEHADDHGILFESPNITLEETDTITIKEDIELKVLAELLCVNEQSINYLNPSYKKQIFPKGSVLILPIEVVNDFNLNEKTNYTFISSVKNKEILINEERIIYRVNNGDYLGSIAEEHSVHVFQIKEWNKLNSSKLNIGDKLVLYVEKVNDLTSLKKSLLSGEYVIKKGDTLWDIAQKHKGLSIWKIKALNNMENDNLKPGTTILLPVS